VKDSGDEVVNGHPIERQMLPRKGDIEIKSNQFIRPRVDTRLPRDGAWLDSVGSTSVTRCDPFPSYCTGTGTNTPFLVSVW